MIVRDKSRDRRSTIFVVPRCLLSHPSGGIKDEEDGTGTTLDEEQTAENLSDGSVDVTLLPMVQYLVNTLISNSLTTVDEGSVEKERRLERNERQTNEASLKIYRERETRGEIARYR